MNAFFSSSNLNSAVSATRPATRSAPSTPQTLPPDASASPATRLIAHPPQRYASVIGSTPSPPQETARWSRQLAAAQQPPSPNTTSNVASNPAPSPPLFYNPADSNATDRLLQGNGNCWAAAALATLDNTPETLRQRLRGIQEQPDGSYQVTLANNSVNPIPQVWLSAVNEKGFNPYSGLNADAPKEMHLLSMAMIRQEALRWTGSEEIFNGDPEGFMTDALEAGGKLDQGLAYLSNQPTQEYDTTSESGMLQLRTQLESFARQGSIGALTLGVNMIHLHQTLASEGKVLNYDPSVEADPSNHAISVDAVHTDEQGRVTSVVIKDTNIPEPVTLSLSQLLAVTHKASHVPDSPPSSP